MLSLEFCENTVKAWKIVGTLVYIVKVMVPIIIIITGIMPFITAITKGTSEELFAAAKKLFFKIIAGLIVFITPGLITSLIDMLNGKDPSTSIEICTSCVNDPFGSTCEGAQSNYESGREKEAKDVEDENNAVEGSLNTGDMNDVSSSSSSDVESSVGITGSSENKGNVQALLQAAREVTDYVKENDFNYGNAPLNPAINHDAKLVSCDRCVGWFLYKIGYTDQPETSGLALGALQNYCASHGFTKITNVSEVQPGDIMFVNPMNNGSPGHTYLLGNPLGNGLWERYDCGSVYRIKLTGQYSGYSHQPFHEGLSTFLYAYRMPGA